MKRLLLVVALGALATACKKPVPVEDPHADGSSATERPGDGSTKDAVTRIGYQFSRVHFAFDSSDLDEGSRAALRESAKILQEHPEVRVEVQGHADERGTTEYNLALGDRRAEAVERFLTSIGVNGMQVTVVSYGEERPLAKGHTETVYSQNRRAEFRIISGESWLSGTVN